MWKKELQKLKLRRCVTEEGILKFKSQLFNVNWDEVLNENDVNVAYTNFVQIFLRLFDGCCPIKPLKYSKFNCDKPWITNGLKNACKKKYNMYKHFLRLRTRESELKYKNYRNKLTTVLRQAENDYYSFKLESLRSDIKGTWKVLRRILNGGGETQFYPKEFKSEGRVVTKKTDIVNDFNIFFCQYRPPVGWADSTKRGR